MEVLKMGINSIDAEDDQFAYRYDTQLLIDRRDKDLDEDEIADYITEHFEGNSLIAAGDEELVKIHFHTNEPWKILEYCQRRSITGRKAEGSLSHYGRRHIQLQRSQTRSDLPVRYTRRLLPSACIRPFCNSPSGWWFS